MAAALLVAPCRFGRGVRGPGGAALAARLLCPREGRSGSGSAAPSGATAPTAFYAVRDFDLDRRPARARLLATGRRGVRPHPERQAGGRRRYLARPGRGSTPTRSGRCSAGGNRLVVELRSGRGAGGLLASLEDERTGETAPGHRRELADLPHATHLGLVRGWLPRSSGGRSEPAFSWGLPARRPLGTARGRDRCVRCFGRAPPARRLGARPGRGRAPDAGARAPATAGPPRGAFDWGREVDRLPRLEVPPVRGDRGRPALHGGERPIRGASP